MKVSVLFRKWLYIIRVEFILDFYNVGAAFNCRPIIISTDARNMDTLPICQLIPDEQGFE